MKITNFIQEFIVQEDREFDSGHASTLLELKNGNVIVSWFAGSWEKGSDVAIWIARRMNGVWEKSGMVPLRRASYDIQALNRPYNKHYCYGKGIIQPTLWQDKDEQVHMLTRSTSSRIFRSDSIDGGRTWSLAYDTGLPNNNSGIDVAALPDGRLVLVYNPRENLPNYYKRPRTPLVVAYSEDNGETFHELAVLEDGSGEFSYPAIICNDKNEIMVSYTWKRETIKFCKLAYED